MIPLNSLSFLAVNKLLLADCEAKTLVVNAEIPLECECSDLEPAPKNKPTEEVLAAGLVSVATVTPLDKVVYLTPVEYKRRDVKLFKAEDPRIIMLLQIICC